MNIFEYFYFFGLRMFQDLLIQTQELQMEKQKVITLAMILMILIGFIEVIAEGLNMETKLYYAK